MMKERKHEKAQVEIIRGSRDGTKKGIEELESDIAYENIRFPDMLGDRN